MFLDSILKTVGLQRIAEAPKFDAVRTAYNASQREYAPDWLKVVDYPKEKYSAYWEIFPFESTEGVGAEVRIIDKASGQMTPYQLIYPDFESLRKAIGALIKEKMENFRRM